MGLSVRVLRHISPCAVANPPVYRNAVECVSGNPLHINITNRHPAMRTGDHSLRVMETIFDRKKNVRLDFLYR